VSELGRKKISQALNLIGGPGDRWVCGGDPPPPEHLNFRPPKELFAMSTKSLVAKSSALAALTLAIVGGGLAATPAAAGHKHHHHGLRVIIGAPLVYGGYGYYNHRSCYWLKKKAWATDSKYWWKRYYNCKHDD
jgi:hypothetical protein